LKPASAAGPAWAVAVHQEASSPLQLATSVQGGRFWAARRAVARGDVVLEEAPLACVVQGQYARDLCHRCLGRLDFSRDGPRGCDRCRFARWCSERCHRADRAAHADECAALEVGRRGGDSRGQRRSGPEPNDAGLRLCLRLLGAAARGGSAARQRLSDLEAHEAGAPGASALDRKPASALDRMAAGLGALSQGRFSGGARSALPAAEVRGGSSANRHAKCAAPRNGFLPLS
jgi:hypothetical protein